MGAAYSYGNHLMPPLIMNPHAAELVRKSLLQQRLKFAAYNSEESSPNKNLNLLHF